MFLKCYSFFILNKLVSAKSNQKFEALFESFMKGNKQTGISVSIHMVYSGSSLLENTSSLEIGMETSTHKSSEVVDFALVIDVFDFGCKKGYDS
jgi:hypothetical protein